RAVARVRRVERAVSGADQELAVLREELVRPPVERRAGMDAEVHVGVEAAFEVDDEAFEPAAAPDDRELRGRARRDLGDRGGPLAGSAHERLRPAAGCGHWSKRPAGPRILAAPAVSHKRSGRAGRPAVARVGRKPCDRVAAMAASEPAVLVRDLAKTFRTGWRRQAERPALSGVSFTVPPGAIFGVLGPNGAGKTTLLSILATLLLPDAGEARVLGLDVMR